jgi:uncharacterized heparinase superfamily protein
MIEKIKLMPLYWHTLKHLRREQWLGRVQLAVRRVFPVQIDSSPAPKLRAVFGSVDRSGRWVAPAARRTSMLGQRRFSFLNEVHDLSGKGDWDNESWPLLWRYNLHYFDDLNALAAPERALWHETWIDDWIRENKTSTGTAFAPYPSSLRIVNWIKWSLRRHRAGDSPSQAFIASLAAQTRLLAQRVEHHLLGNHLFANAKALVFAGAYFEGLEADAWMSRGLEILQREIDEQILSDGGQFELSPMYHALALEDMLDLLNLFNALSGASPGAVPDALPQRYGHFRNAVTSKIGPMRRWLDLMCHPDGEISFFNDAAIGIAPSPVELESYALRLGFPVQPAPTDGVTHLEASGYVRCQRGPWVALLDCAEVGPDYLPGHAHADTLSFELSHADQRVLVNSGTSQYGLGAQREFERSTAAHNTVEVNGKNSSEVWAGFRVARRAVPRDLRIDTQSDDWTVECSQDGYERLPGRVRHQRRWSMNAGGQFEIRDRLTGALPQALGRLHLAPDWLSDGCGQHSVRLRSQSSSVSIAVVANADLMVSPSRWSPEFGRLLPSQCLSYPVGSEGTRVVIEATPAEVSFGPNA